MTETSSETLVRLDVDDAIATITLDSPANRNALSRRLLVELVAHLATARDDASVRGVVLTATGTTFCSGADLSDPPGRGEASSVALPEILTEMWRYPKPIVVRLNGHVRAGGIGLVAAADIVVAPLSATFAFTEVRIGVIPAVISATVLPRLAPRAAAELLLTGDQFDARRAVEVGLVTAAVSAAELDQTVDRYARALLRAAPGALAGTKELLRKPDGPALRARLAELTELSVRYFTSDEGREGITALLGKRDPAWVNPPSP